jgi:hypothetical protein
MVLATFPAPAPVLSTAEDLKAILKALAARQDGYRLAADYYAGAHQLSFATAKFRSTFGSLFSAFADNLSAAVVDAVADRLQVTGFDVEGEGQAAGDDAWALWRQARLPRVAGQVHQEALTSGDAYLIVWPDAEGQVVFYPQAAASTTVTYDADHPGRILRAAKWWRTEDGRVRLTVYYPDRIEKYVTASKVSGGLPTNPRTFLPFEVDGEAWPLANVYEQVPVFHFATNGPIGGFGTSELRDVIPLQNALNKAVMDMLVAMEFVAFRQRWATGLEVPTDPTTGKPSSVPFEPGVDRIWATAGENVRFGTFEASDLTQFLEVQREFRLEIARVSRTPVHYLLMQGQMPSGESLKTAEEPFVRDRQLAFGDVWEAVMAFALRVQGQALLSQLEALWEDPAPRAEKEHLESLKIKAELGVSENQIWTEMGYTEDQVKRIRTERASLDVIPESDQ